MRKSFGIDGIREEIPEDFRSSMSSGTIDTYEFGPYRLDVHRRVFMREDLVVPLPPKTFDLLLLLVQSDGRALSKHELMTALWPDTFVEEANLTFQISTLRKALGNGAEWIETLPKHGYRLVGNVRPISNGDDAGQFPTAQRESSSSAKTTFTTTRWKVVFSGLALIITVASWAALFRARQSENVRSAPPAVVPLTAYVGIASAPSLSPDGSQVAFAWNGPNRDDFDIYVKLVGEGEPHKVTADPSTNDFRPTWSPDGRSIAFRRVTRGTGKADLYVVPALGGAERKVATTNQATFYQVLNRLSWSPDSRWLAYSSDLEHPGIWLVSPDGSEARQLTDLGGGPAFSADGRYMAFIRSGQAGGLTGYVLPLTPDLKAAGPPAQVIPEFPFIRDIAWLPDDRGLIFSSSGHLGLSRLRKIILAPNRLRAASAPELLPFGENGFTVSVLRGGRLAYSTQERDTNILRLSLTGSDRSSVVPIAPSILLEHLPDYSPDGSQIAFSSTRTGAEEIYIADADGTNLKQVTTMGGPVCSGARWSPNGKTILFHSGGREARRQLYLLDVKTGVIRRLTDDSFSATQASWSRDGNTIYFTSDKSKPGQWQIWKIPATGDTPPIQVTTKGGDFALESYDRRVLYYAKDLGSHEEIWQMPVGGGTEAPVVSTPTLWTFAVTRDGLYFVNYVGMPLTRSIDFFDFTTGKHSPIIKLDKATWLGLAVSPDGKYLLYAVEESMKSNLMLVDKFQ